MSKKNYIAFAEYIKKGVDYANQPGQEKNKEKYLFSIDCQINMVCHIARQDNPRFDETRFRAACGL